MMQLQGDVFEVWTFIHLKCQNINLSAISYEMAHLLMGLEA